MNGKMPTIYSDDYQQYTTKSTVRQQLFWVFYRKVHFLYMVERAVERNIMMDACNISVTV